MINTKKNMIFSAITVSITTFFLLLMIINFFYDFTDFPFSVLIIFSFLFIVHLNRSNHVKHHRLNLIDFKEHDYQLDMEHNDEREWRLMLTSTYISQRVAFVYALLVLVIPFVGSKWLTTLSPSLLLSFFISAIGLGIILIEWVYVLSYFHLDH
ncbi:hypothetical protein NVV76_10130 [Pediococcus ethanolidurans]|uniref:hypothetical protein n=1 Tax=Pediococcus ethanolidurans TaxID=319653 RepID=UPI0021AA9FB4|nr:hypothetical protein [Pediococcus ethanolidurans]MCT4397359.1 hypothetical protein [Pediococcus ethanolidurans]MCV3322510.1 hypothetical protein [Pediococcus ethanolidurans]MCV3328508.1 hypothetical protein [Pediococcus ethanolidurans]